MARTISYSPNRSGTLRVMRSTGVRQMLRRRAEAAIPYAQSISPERTGEYKRSFKVEDGNYTGSRGEERPEARLVNTSDHALAVESKIRGGGMHILGLTADHIEGSDGDLGEGL